MCFCWGSYICVNSFMALDLRVKLSESWLGVETRGLHYPSGVASYRITLMPPCAESVLGSRRYDGGGASGHRDVLPQLACLRNQPTRRRDGGNPHLRQSHVSGEARQRAAAVSRLPSAFKRGVSVILYHPLIVFLGEIIWLVITVHADVPLSLEPSWHPPAEM